LSEDALRQVRFYLDFVSPYTYLALMRAHEFARANQVEWQLRPVVYGALLDVTGLVGPVEAPAKRRYTHRDILRSARLSGIPLAGPPEHPFRSLEALESGVFGVPSFEYEGDIFWGHDRLDHLAARLTGELADLGPELDEMERRPSGVTRKSAPNLR